MVANVLGKVSSSTICAGFLAKLLTYHRYYSWCTNLNLACSTSNSTLLMKYFDEYYTFLCVIDLSRVKQMLICGLLNYGLKDLRIQGYKYLKFIWHDGKHKQKNSN